MSSAVCGFNAVTERGDDDDAIARLHTGYAKLQPNHEGTTALPAAERDKLRRAVLAELRTADVEIEVAYL